MDPTHGGVLKESENQQSSKSDRLNIYSRFVTAFQPLRNTSQLFVPRTYSTAVDGLQTDRHFGKVGIRDMTPWNVFHYTIGHHRTLLIPLDIKYIPSRVSDTPLQTHWPCISVISAFSIVMICIFRRRNAFWFILNRSESIGPHVSHRHTTAWHMLARETCQLINWKYLPLLKPARCVWHVYSECVQCMYFRIALH